MDQLVQDPRVCRGSPVPTSTGTVTDANARLKKARGGGIAGGQSNVDHVAVLIGRPAQVRPANLTKVSSTKTGPPCGVCTRMEMDRNETRRA